jgi:tRNA pseudouridine38-40 synthase
VEAAAVEAAADNAALPDVPDAAGPAILLTVAYDGRGFAGFAPQPSQRTIAGELLGALRALDPTIREVRGASRTDAGVHARDQRVAFDPTASIPPRGWVLGATRHLPPEIAVRRAALVPAGFTPRFRGVAKTYRYLIVRDLVRDPFLEGRAWRVEGLIPDGAVAIAREEAARAIGTHDFAAFRSSSDERERTVRTLHAVDVLENAAEPRLLSITVRGDAFMHNMVRILVGTIVDVARGRLAPGAIARAIASRDRRDAGITAPPDGLCLDRVELEDEGHSPWPTES